MLSFVGALNIISGRSVDMLIILMLGRSATFPGSGWRVLHVRLCLPARRVREASIAAQPPVLAIHRQQCAMLETRRLENHCARKTGMPCVFCAYSQT